MIIKEKTIGDQTESLVKVDKRFVETAVNCMLGMMSGKNFGDVFDSVETADMRGPTTFNKKQLTMATIMLLMELTNGDERAVKMVGEVVGKFGVYNEVNAEDL